MDIAFLSNFNIVFGPNHWILTKIWILFHIQLMSATKLETLATLDCSCSFSYL